MGLEGVGFLWYARRVSNLTQLELSGSETAYIDVIVHHSITVYYGIL